MSVVKDNFSMVAVNDNFKDNTITVSKKKINIIIIKDLFKDNFNMITILFDETIDVSKEVIAFTFFQMVAEVITPKWSSQTFDLLFQMIINLERSQMIVVVLSLYFFRWEGSI